MGTIGVISYDRILFRGSLWGRLQRAFGVVGFRARGFLFHVGILSRNT